MMKMCRKILIAFCILVNSQGFSQDFHLSIYDGAPLYLNPSMTGVVEGSWRIHTHYRTQWKAVNFKPYVTGLVSFDMPYKKWGFGGQIVNYRAGIGNYNALQGLASVAYTLSLDRNQYNNISFGLQGGVTQKSVVHQLHTFDNQYTTSNGGVFDNSLPNGESFNGQSFIIPELNFGAMYYFSKQQSKLNPFIGASAFNLLQPKESFFGVDNTLPLRLYVHTGIRINLTETIYIIPKALFMQQKEFSELTFAGDVGFYLKAPEVFLLGGIVYRNKDAAVISIGARKINYIVKFAYDINLSTLSTASTGRGGFEVSFTYMHQKADAQNVKICPRL